MRLLAVELRRFRARRAVVVVLLLTLAAAAVLAGSALWSTRGASAAELSQAQQQLEAETDATRGQYLECLADPPPQPEDVPADERCEELNPKLDWFLPRESLDLAGELGGRGLALALILAGAAVVVGTTFAGADWQSGSLSTQLLFRPRRTPLWVAKALALVMGVSLSALVVSAAHWLTLGVVAEARGLPVSGELALDVSLHAARSTLLAAAAALGAFALTMALRSTLVTLALLFVYTVAGEALWASLAVPESGRWSLSANVQAWVLDGLRVSDEAVCDPSAGPCDPTYLVSAAHGAVYLVVLLTVAVVISLLVFRRRDVP